MLTGMDIFLPSDITGRRICVLMWKYPWYQDRTVCVQVVRSCLNVWRWSAGAGDNNAYCVPHSVLLISLILGCG